MGSRMHQRAFLNYNPAATADDGSCNLDYMCLEGTVYDPELMG